VVPIPCKGFTVFADDSGDTIGTAQKLPSPIEEYGLRTHLQPSEAAGGFLASIPFRGFTVFALGQGV